jgi:hypothetical protein
MSETLRVNLLKSGVTYKTNIVVQLDKMNVHEAAEYQGSDPHFTYRVLTINLPLTGPYLVSFRDHMIDQVVIDPITNALRKYLIISDPEMHVLDGHWQWVCTRMRGT